MKTKYLIEAQGWFLFCPCWFAFEGDGGAVPIPKYKLSWLFELAVWIQQIRNFFLSLIDPEFAGFPMYIKDLTGEPFELEV